MSKVNDNSRKETRLGNAEQKATDVELPGGRYKGRQRGDQTPGDQYSGEPFARAPMFDEQCSGHFQDQIADEEDSKTKAENSFRKLQVICHRQLGKTYVCPVEVSDNIDQKYERQNAPCHLATDSDSGIDNKRRSHQELGTRHREFNLKNQKKVAWLL